jgi:hypothetical protein
MTLDVRRSLVRAFVPSPALGAAVAAFVATLACPSNPDTLWHLAVGRWIFAHRAIPDISGFYYSASAGFGYDYSWLSQVLLFGAYRCLGGAGVAILTSAVSGFMFYLLYRLLERDGANMLLNTALLGLALTTLGGCLSGRPMMFTVALLALEVSILSGFARSRSRLIWLIPPVTALWANLHPGFAIAPLVILAFMPLVRERRDRWILVACLAATGLAVMVNPFGWRLYLMPFETARSMSMLRGLSEWTSVSGWEAVVWGGFVALVAVGVALRRQPLPVLLLGTLTALAAGVSNRNMPLFGVIAVFILGRSLMPVLTPLVRRLSLVRKFDAPPVAAGGWFWAAAVPVLLAGAVRMQPTLLDLRFDFSRYPTAAVQYLANHHCPDNLFVRETWSSYLLWAMSDRKLFFDAKGGFSREAAEGHSALVKPKAGWRGVADRNGLSTFLLERGSPLAVVLSEADGWRRQYSDSLAEIFVRVPCGRGEDTGCSSSPVPGGTPQGSPPCRLTDLAEAESRGARSTWNGN